MALPRRFTRMALPIVSPALLLLVLSITASSGCENSDQKTTPAPNTSPQADVPAYMPTDSPAVVGASTPWSGSSPASAAAPGQIATPQSEALSAREVLEATIAAMEAVSSGHVKVEMTIEGLQQLGSDHSLSMAGDFQSPDRQQFTTIVNSGSGSVEFDVIAIGTDLYTRSANTGRWKASPPSSRPPETLLDPRALLLDLDPVIAQGPTLLGQEDLNGQRVYHLKAVMSGKALAEALDLQPSGSWKGDVEIWVGVNDFLIRKSLIQIESPVDTRSFTAGANPITTRVMMSLSDFGKTVDIQAPQVQIPGAAKPPGPVSNRREEAKKVKVVEVKPGRVVPLPPTTPAPGTIVVPAPFEYARVNVSESDPPYYFLELVSVLPNTCHTFDRIDLSRSEEEITVSITNRLPGNLRAECRWESRFITHSLPLGSDFEPGETYTVRVNAPPGPPVKNPGPVVRRAVKYSIAEDHITMTFTGRSTPPSVTEPNPDTVSVLAYTQAGMGIKIDDARPPQHSLDTQSAVIGCGEFERYDVERSGDDIFVSIWNRRPIEETCSSVGIRNIDHTVSLGNDLEPGVPYTLRVNSREGQPYARFWGWLDYDRVAGYDTAMVPAPIKRINIYNHPDGWQELNWTSIIPTTCSEFGDTSVERDGAQLKVSITNRVAVDPRADCKPVYQSQRSGSLLIGSDFEPGVTYTVQVNDLSTTFAGQPPFETQKQPAPIESAEVGMDESDPLKYHVQIEAGLLNNRCILFDHVAFERSGTDIDLFVRQQLPTSAYVPCLDAGPLPQTHRVTLGSDFQPGVTYTVRVNDFWTKNGESPPPGTVHLEFVAK